MAQAQDKAQPKSQPAVTVGVPTYNRPQLLHQALTRLTQQTYRNIEILVSDNCSPDEAAVRAVVDKFQDPRIRYVRQQKNLGAIRNLKYLLDNAQHPYFMWAADDDLLENTYIEKLVQALEADSSSVLAMSGYDLLDRISNPEIRVGFSKHLKKLPAPGRFRRLYNYVRQPEYYGKIRILWGLGRTAIFRQAFAETLASLKPDEELKWHLLPIELRMLSHGNLAFVDEVLFHAQLLPTSDGNRESSVTVGEMKKMCTDSFLAYGKVIREAHLPEWQKSVLNCVLSFQKFHSMSRVLPFYFLRQRAPGLARAIKYLWFKLLVGKGARS